MHAVAVGQATPDRVLYAAPDGLAGASKVHLVPFQTSTNIRWGVPRASRRVLTPPTAAQAVADLSDAGTPGDPLLPPMTDLRSVSAAVAARVAATAAEEGLARVELTDLVQQVHAAMWRPEYPVIDQQN